MKNNYCILCDSTDYKIIHTYNEPDAYERVVGVESKGYYRQWCMCLGCGFYYSRFSRDPSILNRIYVSDYRSANTSWRDESPEKLFKKVTSLPYNQSETKQRVHWIKGELRTIQASGFCNKASGKKRLLDIGGGTGVFAYEFRDEHWDVCIVDPSESGCFLKEKYGLEYHMEYYKPDIFKEEFNLITLVFVLEHVGDPISFLNSVKRNMNSDTIIFIEVPDTLSFKYKFRDDDIFNSCHLWMFDPASIANIFKRISLEVISLKREKIVRGHYTLKVLGGLS